MYFQQAFALVWLQLIMFSAALVPQPSGVQTINSTMASDSQVADPILGRYVVIGTQVSLGFITTSHDAPIAAIDILMCVILGMDKLGEMMGGDPLEHGKVTYEYGGVEITLQDQGTPHGRFTNDIGFSTLRGLAQWMTQYSRYIEITATVTYNNVHYCGIVTVKKVGMSSNAANETAVLTAPTAVASSAGAGDIAAA